MCEVLHRWFLSIPKQYVYISKSVHKFSLPKSDDHSCPIVHYTIYIICFEVYTLISSLKTQDQLVYEVLGVSYVEIWNNLLHLFSSILQCFGYKSRHIVSCSKIELCLLRNHISTLSELLEDWLYLLRNHNQNYYCERYLWIYK